MIMTKIMDVIELSKPERSAVIHRGDEGEYLLLADSDDMAMVDLSELPYGARQGIADADRLLEDQVNDAMDHIKAATEHHYNTVLTALP